MITVTLENLARFTATENEAELVNKLLSRNIKISYDNEKKILVHLVESHNIYIPVF